MSKLSAVFTLTLLLMTITLSSYTTLSHSRMLGETLAQTHQLQSVEAKHAEVENESCEGAADEECLMRRTLAAHLDYIYTQKQKP